MNDGHPLSAAGLAGSLAALALLVGCGQAPGGGPEQPAVMSVPLPRDILTLDPARADEITTYNVVRLIYEGLVDYDPRTLEIVPRLARAWEISRGGLEWQFEIREGARFTDDPCFPSGAGRDVTAEDARYSLERGLSVLRGAGAAAGVLPSIEGVDEFLSGRSERIGGISADSARVLRIHLRRVEPNLLHFLTRPACRVVPREAVEAYGEGMREHAVGTGPFRLASWEPLSGILLVRNLGTWQRDSTRQWPRIDALRFIPTIQAVSARLYAEGKLDVAESFIRPQRSSEDPVSAADPLTRHAHDGTGAEEAERSSNRAVRQPSLAPPGGIGGATALDPASVAAGGVAAGRGGRRPAGSETEPRERHYWVPRLNTIFVRFDVRSTHPAVRDKRLRRALTFGVSRPMGVAWQPASGLLPPGMPGYEPPPDGQRTDPAEARRLIREAGFAGGRGLAPLRLAWREWDEGMGRRVADSIRAVGLPVDLTLYGDAGFQAAVEARRADLFRAGWIADYPDPQTFLELFLSGAPQNAWGPANETFDRLFEAFRIETDRRRRLEMARRLERILLEDVAAIFLHHERQSLYVSSRVIDWEANGTNPLGIVFYEWLGVRPNPGGGR